MSLTQTDLQQIREIVREGVRYEVSKQLEPLVGKVEALSNDVKEIYDMIVGLKAVQ